ncbi:MAG: DUF928 domain-containing protein [Elainellaceae cyanobacterium]
MKAPNASLKLAYAPAAVASMTTLVAAATGATAQFTPLAPSAPSPRHVIPLVARYTPPPSARGAPTRVSSGTSRGILGQVSERTCSASSPSVLVPLAPQTHVGQTASVQPTLMWYMPEVAATTIDLSIVEQGGGDEVLHQIENKVVERSASGIVMLPLAEEGLRLAPDAVYVWQVTLECDSDAESTFEAYLEVVASTDATAPLSVNAAERASRYAEEGLWYDALGSAASAEEGVAQQIQRSLLQSLAELEAEGAPDFSDSLNQVIDGIP